MNINISFTEKNRINTSLGVIVLKLFYYLNICNISLKIKKYYFTYLELMNRIFYIKYVLMRK